MKRLIIIPILFICLTLSATKYYVAPTTATPAGNDANAGTITLPMATFAHAVTHATAGDTVYFRGGTYPMTDVVRLSTSGTAGNYINFWNYPSESPVFDGQGMVPYYDQVTGISTNGKNYIYFKGLKLQNYPQVNWNDWTIGFFALLSTNIKYENCVVDYIEGNGFQTDRCRKVYYINCDASNCADTLRAAPGNGGAGFSFTGTPSTYDTISYEGCRGWHCSDDGFHGDYEGLVILNRCWSWNNGYLAAGGGNGFKVGYLLVDVNPLARIVTNCISTYNNRIGFHENSYTGQYQINGHWYNNTSYHNGSYGFFSASANLAPENENIYKNNISYANTIANFYAMVDYDGSNNSWDASPAITVSDADFVDLPADVAECNTVLGAARGADGSLPSLGDLFQIAAASDLIGTGIGVGLVYDGASPTALYHNDPPDLGALAYDADEPAPPDLPGVSTTAITTYNAYIATLGGTITSDGGGTLTASGIVWDEDINPTLSDNVIQAYELTEDTFTVLLRNIGGGVTLHIRAFATNETGTSYGADVSLTTPAYAIMKSATKIYFLNGKPMIYK